jgi:transposase
MAVILPGAPLKPPLLEWVFLFVVREISSHRNDSYGLSVRGQSSLAPDPTHSQKQRMSGAPGNSFLRMLLVEAAHSVVRLDEGFRKQYAHRCHSKPKGIAKVAAARRLAVRLYWMLRTNTPYPEIVRIESSPRVPLVGKS